MDKKLFSALPLAALAVSAAVLTGCSSDDSSAAATGQNTEACSQFEAAHNDFAGIVSGPTNTDIDAWTAAKDADVEKFGTAMAAATGDVQAALTTLTAALPADTLTLTEPDSESGQKFVDNSAAVASACSADDSDITLAEFPLVKFTN